MRMASVPKSTPIGHGLGAKNVWTNPSIFITPRDPPAAARLRRARTQVPQPDLRFTSARVKPGNPRSPGELTVLHRGSAGRGAIGAIDGAGASVDEESYRTA